MTSRVALIGFDLDILDLAQTCGFKVDGYFDQIDHGRIPYLGKDTEGRKYSGNTVLCMQSSSSRQILWPYNSDTLITIISPKAHVSSGALIGLGTTIHHYTAIMPEVRIGKAVQIHPGTLIHHETIVGDFSTLSPKSLVLGRVTIGEGVSIGAGAIIKENTVIGDGAVIGAGAVVVRDVGPEQTVVGVPAVPLVSS